jgi:hypothetical protein
MEKYYYNGIDAIIDSKGKVVLRNIGSQWGQIIEETLEMKDFQISSQSLQKETEELLRQNSII